ncbi:type II secretion system protein, partial [bacterium]|nr:type II secretion system protein [bacterium]
MKKFGFTMAEVLITIGIIGVVAAITIPLLMQNSNSKKFTTQFKKSLSTLNQAAIGAQAQYDLDYSLLTQINDDATCKSNTLAGGQYNFCGLFNNTLAGHTYLGKYGNVKGANLFSPYSANVTSFSIENFLFFSFADGAIVAFNPNAKSCGIGVGQTLTNEKLTSNLANCIGFIDVNGTTPPNKEVQCAEGTTTISANTTCKVTNGSMGDIFPVVFHDGAVEPATNASLAAFLGGNGKEELQLTEEELEAQRIAKRRQFDKWEPQ